MTNLTPVAIVEPRNGELIVRVEYPYAGVDRPHTHGWNVGPSTPAKRRLASRLCRAIEYGAVEQNRHIATDVNGHTYVASTPAVIGRTLNADLTRLGF